MVGVHQDMRPFAPLATWPHTRQRVLGMKECCGRAGLTLSQPPFGGRRRRFPCSPHGNLTWALVGGYSVHVEDLRRRRPL